MIHNEGFKSESSEYELYDKSDVWREPVYLTNDLKFAKGVAKSKSELVDGSKPIVLKVDVTYANPKVDSNGDYIVHGKYDTKELRTEKQLINLYNLVIKKIN